MKNSELSKNVNGSRISQKNQESEKYNAFIFDAKKQMAQDMHKRDIKMIKTLERENYEL